MKLDQLSRINSQNNFPNIYAAIKKIFQLRVTYRSDKKYCMSNMIVQQVCF